MLSGIRTGKAKKKKAKTGSNNDPSRQKNDANSGCAEDRARHPTSDRSMEGNNNNNSSSSSSSNTTTTTTTTTNNNNAIRNSNKNRANLSVAERLKQALAAGVPFQNSSKSVPSSLSSSKSYMQRVFNESNGASTASGGATANNDNGNDFETIVLGAPGAATSYNKKREDTMTVAELAAKERSTGGENSMSWNEHMARDIMRVGKKRKIKTRTTAGVDSDEEVEQMKRHLPDYHRNENSGGISSKKSDKELEKEEQRNKRREIDRYQKQEKLTSMCSWWINSSSFSKHRLLAFGKHVSLVMAPPTSSLVPGHQFYLVPLKHAPSMVDCDDHDVREEMKLFRNSLENLYAKERKGIVLCETVLPNKNFWQTRVEVVPIPFSQLQDAPIYFKSAMVEQTEEYGTHTKLFRTSTQKPLQSVVPKRFPYFHIDWGNIATTTTTGYAQIIESSEFPRDFGLDTLAGMMEVDPVRFQRKAKFAKDLEAKLVAEFAVKWKSFDWTQRITDY